jgi:hypothetical protein
MKVVPNGQEHEENNPFCPACFYDPQKPKRLRRCTTCSKLIHAEVTENTSHGIRVEYRCGCGPAL